MNFFVYILFSETIQKYYIGQTNNLEIRMQRHLQKTTRFTKQANDWQLLYSEKYSTRAEAMQREKQIKQMKSKKYIVDLISNSDSTI